MEHEKLKQIKPIDGCFGFDNFYITENGEIYRRVPTEQRNGVEVLTTGMYIYNVQDLADLTFKN